MEKTKIKKIAKTALISVYDKFGIVEFAKSLIKNNYQIISTNGTFQFLLQNGINSTPIEKIIKFPEILNGKVKTLHPYIHAGILFNRNNKEDLATINKYNINVIDIVIVNLYPFLDKVKENKLSIEEKLNFIDIGGVTILRSAAKSFIDVTVIYDKLDYNRVIHEINKYGSTLIETRKKLASKVFDFTAYYDSSISHFLVNKKFPNYFFASYKKKYDLRYGENPHQKASYYTDNMNDGFMKDFEQISGKKLSFNNIRDIDLAWKVVSEFNGNFACSIIKHSTPCGVALGDSGIETYKKSYKCDPISIFGGIVAMNYTIDLHIAKELNKLFLEIIIANDFDSRAINELKKKKNLRIIKIHNKSNDKYQLIKVDGGLLVQETDLQFSKKFKIVTKIAPTESQIKYLTFAQKVCKYVKSNAIVVAKNTQTIGICGGAVNRIDAVHYALKKAGKQNSTDIVLASDAFFPFRDIIDIAKKFNISAIIQPGGSIRDKDSIKACNEYKIPMIFTGMRHFLH